MHLSPIIYLHGISFECLFRGQIYKFENPIKRLKLSMDPPGTEARGLAFMSESRLQRIGRTLTCYWIQRICGGRFLFLMNATYALKLVLVLGRCEQVVYFF